MSATDDMMNIIPVAIGAGLVMHVTDRMLGGRKGRNPWSGNPFRSAVKKAKKTGKRRMRKVNKYSFARPF